MKTRLAKERTPETNQGRAGPVFSLALATVAGLVSVSALSNTEGKTYREARAKAARRTL